MAGRNPRRRRPAAFPSGRGLGVDAEGSPVIDPTQNVMDWFEAGMKRQDDLREAESRHVREVMAMHERHAREMRTAETERINAIRLVDVGAVATASAAATAAAQALAVQLTQTTEASRGQLAAAAQSARGELMAAVEPLRKDVEELRKALYQTQGGRAGVIEARESRGETRLNYGAVLGGLAFLVSMVGLIVLLTRQ